MKNACFCLFMLCALAGAQGCRAPARDWNGTWKLKPSKSNYLGPVITISISANGEYRYDDGMVTNTFRCDGKYQPIGNNLTQACVKDSATTLDRTRMENGVKTNTYHWELSDGGKVFTSTATELRPTGPAVLGQLVASRISGSNDFAGQWRDTSFLQWHSEMMLKLDKQFLHIGYPSSGQYVDAPLNGADAPMYGHLAVPGMTYAVRMIGQREFLFLGKRNGKALSQESLELSDDGTVLTDSWWNPDNPSAKCTLVYEQE